MAMTQREVGGPDWFVFDIPKPPSVNRLQGHFGNRSNCVTKWAVQADRWLMAMGQYPHIKGPYELIVALPEKDFGKYDADNRIKVLSDWLQRVQIIENDKLCRELWVRWTASISAGCRVSVRAWREA
jgi:Holliday junction resolvase RusA-like endonuclease